MWLMPNYHEYGGKYGRAKCLHRFTVTILFNTDWQSDKQWTVNKFNYYHNHKVNYCKHHSTIWQKTIKFNTFAYSVNK